MTQADNPESLENLKAPEANGIARKCQDECETNKDDMISAGNSDGTSENCTQEASLEAEKLRQELAAAHDKYLRLLADFDNFKKRTQKERTELLKYQGEQIIIDLLSVVDDFDLAIQFKEGEFKDSDPENFRKGIELIYKGLCDVLSKWNIRPESSIGKVFDPSKHLAISRVSCADASPNTVISELKKAVYYKDKIIRVGEVVVAAEPAS